ncbi:MAG TPA: hypothetical protein VGW76_11045 [Pyrinomonadaceae bacterium]|nr:hypothetical protein [Pyrinomonadaceae bacterium]
MFETQSLKRLRFSTGQVLTAENLELEQQYFREKLKRHNRTLHGFGIVSGLKVIVQAGQIIVEPGLALDCEGNELVVPGSQTDAPDTDALRAAFVSLRYVEMETDEIPVVLNEPATTSIENCTGPSTITESVAIEITPDNCNRSHRHLHARWLACGQSHALTIAKLKHTVRGWRVERGYRPPMIK